MKKAFVIVSTAISLGLSSPVLMAQKFEVGAGLGLMHYKGDISPNFHPSFARPGANLFFRYNLSRAVSLKANALYGGIHANDSEVNNPFNQARGRTFNTRIAEAGAQIEYNFLTYKFNVRRHHNWSPYVFGGAAFSSFNPDGAPTASYKTSGVVLPFGIGIKVQYKTHWNFGVEFGTRRTFTDYLDNWGEGSSIPNQKLQQADPTNKDMYYFTAFSVSYMFFKVVCPE